MNTVMTPRPLAAMLAAGYIRLLADRDGDRHRDHHDHDLAKPLDSRGQQSDELAAGTDGKRLRCKRTS
jgi:hypothetical protein